MIARFDGCGRSIACLNAAPLTCLRAPVVKLVDALDSKAIQKLLNIIKALQICRFLAIFLATCTSTPLAQIGIGWRDDDTALAAGQ